MVFEIGEFKGNKLAILKKTPDDSYPFSFGLNKAKLILEHIDEIKEFVKNNDKLK